MQSITTTLTLAAVCALAPVAPAIAPVVPVVPGTDVIQAVEIKLDEALMNMGVLSEIGGVTAADVGGIGDLVDDFFDSERPSRPSSALLRQSLETYLEELKTRAQRAWVKKQHVAFLRREIVESQLDLVLQELIFRARQNNWTASHFQAVRAKLIARAEAAVDSPSSTYLRRRFEELSSQATTRAQNAFAEKLEKYRIELIEFRLNNALEKLRAQRRVGDLSPVGFNRMVTLLHRQAREAAGM